MSEEITVPLQPNSSEQTTDTSTSRSKGHVHKRKRSNSESLEANESELSSMPKKKYVQVNGESDREDGVPMVEEDDELVAILDAGAQYGKVSGAPYRGRG